MNKKELVAAVAEKAGLSAREASDVLDSLIEVIDGELVKGGEVKLSGFGVFAVRTRAARKGTNPSTGAQITIPEAKAVVFKASKNLKLRVH